VSASIAMTSFVRTQGMAKVCAPALEPVFAGGRITVAPHARATPAVSSVEQSSMTMISSGGRVCACRLLIVSARLAASL
jgi:hypothetical protein